MASSYSSYRKRVEKLESATGSGMDAKVRRVMAKLAEQLGFGLEESPENLAKVEQELRSGGITDGDAGIGLTWECFERLFRHKRSDVGTV